MGNDADRRSLLFSVDTHVAGSLSPQQSLGQNFLQDPNTAAKIAGALQAPRGAPVVEIGPGLGALTGLLHQRYADFSAVEVDARAVDVLRAEHPGLDVRHADVLEIDWATEAAARGGRLHVISNLPYNITSPVLFGLLEARPHIAEAVLMMQKEVAERLVAVPRTKAYGILSVMLQLFAEPELLFSVSRNVFYPKPDVTSAVVRLTFERPEPDVAYDDVRAIVRAAFNQRRKTLRNSLHAWTRDQGLALPDGWERRRAEELEPEEFITLTRYLLQQM